eukprot:TRINITY_DN1560_c0_g2_i2.p1 TRINITY_DN1560_c0_g2~~TRINITY_DN1560_c0_g2_i2.p1  ORF type:complete len:293 (-),score=91.94 TRINITY_DN1560_c0_g2_i2:169-996(-)
MFGILSKRKAFELKKKGNNFYQKCNHDKALKCYEEAIKLDPSNSNLYHNCALVYKHRRNWHSAIKYATLAVSIDKSYSKALAIWGQGLVELGKDDSDVKRIKEGIGKLEEACFTNNNVDLEAKFGEHVETAKKILELKAEQSKAESKEHFLKFVDKLLKRDKADEDEKESVRKQVERITEYNENDYSKVKATDFLNCGITLNLMRQPVITNEEHTYDEEALERHFAMNNRLDPSTRKQINDVYQNLAVKEALQKSHIQYIREQQLNLDYRDLHFN